ncbi:MAG: hypothetical protein KAV41_00610 [Candidatus Pacebacteria bacterium]|nr:hypothetical protein [Candidatus Paceibacterota bacterium]
MPSFFDIYKKNKILHHAYLLEGEKEIIFRDLAAFLKRDFNFSVVGNPDFWLGDFDSFGIKDSWEIKDFQSKKAIAGDKKILIIKTNFITQEAQNSLLKIFEEPTEQTHLFLIMPSAEALLPTLKSRLTIINNLETRSPSQKLGDQVSKLGAGEFLGADVARRFELIKVFLPKKKEEKADKIGAILFLNELEQTLYKNYKEDGKRAAAKPPPAPQNAFQEIIKCRSYLNDRSPSVKMILEHLSQIISKFTIISTKTLNKLPPNRTQ